MFIVIFIFFLGEAMWNWSDIGEVGVALIYLITVNCSNYWADLKLNAQSFWGLLYVQVHLGTVLLYLGLTPGSFAPV